MKILFLGFSALLLLANVASAQVVGIRDTVPFACLSEELVKEHAELLSQGRMREVQTSVMEAVEASQCGPVGLPGELSKVVATFGDWSAVEFTFHLNIDGNEKELKLYTVVKVKTDSI